MKNIEITLVRADIEEWVMSGEKITQDEIDLYVKKYVQAVQNAIGFDYVVTCNDNIIQDSIDGKPAHYANEEDYDAYNEAIKEINRNWEW